MSKVVVIGGGASGMIAAMMASREHEVVLLEGNDKCGKKLLLTGNGKCNYWHDKIDESFYHTDDVEKLRKILKYHDDVFSFLMELGIYPKVKNGYYYPHSGQASSIYTLFMKKLESQKVKIITGFKVSNIGKENDKFMVSSSSDRIVCDKVILAAGSKACSKTGSDGSSYELAKQLGHTISTLSPSLVPLVSNDSILKDWKNVRCDGRVSLFVDDNLTYEEEGEIQLTDYGVSGICIFNMSGVVAKNLSENKKVVVCINFLPFLDENISSFLDNRSQLLKTSNVETLLESILPYPLLLALLKKVGIERDELLREVSGVKREQLESYLTRYPLEILDVLSFDRAQVVSGGVPLKEIKEDTMESLLVDHLFMTGELLDVDGICGGYNLAFAFISGYLAGRSV